MSTITRTKTSSGPPRLNGIRHFPARPSALVTRKTVYARPTSAEQTRQQRNEQGDDDQERERREVTEGQDEGHFPFHLRRGLQKPLASGASQIITCVFEHVEGALSELTRALEALRDPCEGCETGHFRFVDQRHV